MSVEPDISAFSEVDERSQGDPLIGFLDQSRSLPGVRIAKSLLVKSLGLRPGQSVLEFGLAGTVIDHPDPQTTERIIATSAAQTADGRAGRGLRRRFVDSGLADITVRARFVVSTYPFLRGLLMPSLQALQAAGELTPQQSQAWLDAFAESWDSGRFTGGAPLFIASARRP